MSPGTVLLIRQALETKRLRLANEERSLAKAEADAAAIRADRDETAASITDLEGFLIADGLEP